MTIAHPAREFYSMPIDPETEPRNIRVLELSARANTALHSAGYTTIDELLEMSEEALLEVPGLSVRGAQEVLRGLIPYRDEVAVDDYPFTPEDEDLELPPEGEGVWRPVSYHDVVEDLYEVSENATVRRIDTGTVLKPYKAGHQIYVGLRHGKKPDQSKSVRLDQLVLESFKGRSKTKKPLHTDDDPDNCRLDNLVWASSDHPKFKEQRSKNAKRAAASRAKSVAKVSRGQLPVPSGRDRVSVMRTYGFGNISITINDENLGSWPQGLSTPQDRADALIVLQQINEMDKFMGLI